MGLLKAYFSIHNHTEYSNLRLLDSINKVRGMFARAIELNLQGFAITDHECLSAHVQAIQVYKELLEKGEITEDFKLGLGDEIYLVDDATQEGEKPYGFTHFILVAKNQEGHRQIREISSQAWANSYHGKGMERVPISKAQLKSIIGNNKGNIVATTACLGGELAKLTLRMIDAERNEPAKVMYYKSKITDFILYCKDIFGDDFHIEIQPSHAQEQIDYNKRVMNIAKFFGVKTIFATDSHYLRKEDRHIHKSFLNSKEGEREVDDFYATAYMMSAEEMYKEYFSKYMTIDEYNAMAQRTRDIGNQIEFYDLHKPQFIPEVEVTKYDKSNRVVGFEYLTNMLSSDFEQDRYWVNECLNSLESKNLLNDLYLKRLNDEAKELWNISTNMGLRMTSYYNTMKFIIELTWDKGDSLVGPARGSATGFLSCYLLGITQLDPIQWNLPHWRHLTETRPELPDIDFDTQATRRKQILQAVKDVFGRDNVLNIATFGTEGSKSSCLTACRGYRSEEFPDGIDSDIAQYLTSMIPSERGQLWSLSDVVYGNKEKDRKPVSLFVKEVSQYEGLLEIMLNIEGMINKRSIHASGVYIYNNGYLEYNAMMKAPNGQEITQFNMNDSDYMGSLKYDFLTIEALDKIRVALDLLEEDDVIQNQGSLKATYDKYLHPDVLTYDDKDMWDLMGSGEVINLFQFDTAVGSQCAKKVKPHSLVDAASANSLMRLMGEKDGEQPVDRYIRMKNNIQLWYNEMKEYGLTQDEISILEPHYLPVFGTPNTQEDMMETLMNDKITGFDLVLANKARKIVAKKKMGEVAGFEKLFYEKGMALGNREVFLKYVWDTNIKPQLGYSFSRNHTTPYTTIALQELNLYKHYPSIYWNTACLTVNAGSADEEADDKKSTDYAKIATAIGDIMSRGVTVSLADINQSGFGFKPDAKGNRIIFGLKGINNVGDDLVHEIIKCRPYTSLNDFLSKVTINKQAMVALIKGGAFDELEGNRLEVMTKYLWETCDKKKRLTLQNFNGLIEAGLIPQELDFERRTFNFNKYLKAVCKKGTNYVLDEPAFDFFSNFFDTDEISVENGRPVLEVKVWEKDYKRVMDKAREWLKSNHDEVLKTYNEMIFQNEWNKYAAGNLSTWEMESLCFYYNEHELAHVNRHKYGISNFSELPLEPEVESTFKRNGKEIPIFKLNKIVGTCIGKNKTKGTVSLLTTDGVVTVKFRPEYFAMFDKQMSERQADGTKKIVEKSWFNRGSMIMLTGMRRGDQFIPKKYAKTVTHQLYKIDEVTEDGDIKIRSERYGEAI